MTRARESGSGCRAVRSVECMIQAKCPSAGYAIFMRRFNPREKACLSPSSLYSPLYKQELHHTAAHTHTHTHTYSFHCCYRDTTEVKTLLTKQFYWKRICTNWPWTNCFNRVTLLTDRNYLPSHRGV